MESFQTSLIALLTADTFEQTVELALTLFIDVISPHTACLLLWDVELGRYIVGATSASPDAPDFRRFALQTADQAREIDPLHARCVETGIFYQPLYADDQHIGAFLSSGVLQMPDLNEERYRLFLKSVARALYTSSRLREATLERIQLEAERVRLEQLLRAVEQQQRTIDRLLAAERELSISLETKVEERTAALRAAQHRLLQSEKLAVIGQLASSLAHELNNPLQAIQSGLGLVIHDLERGNLRQMRGDLNIILAELERIQVIFRQMLDFYRPVSFGNIPLDLNAICEGVQILMRKRLQDANVTLSLDLCERLPLTCGDSNQIKQVLLNLMFNALEAVVPSKGHISIGTGVCHQEVCLTVKDNGTGIGEQHIKRLFEPLFTTKTRGLGLGLAISHEIIQRHQGRVTVQSSINEGTTFTVWLPVRESCK